MSREYSHSREMSTDSTIEVHHPPMAVLPSITTCHTPKKAWGRLRTLGLTIIVNKRLKP
jgi:hypothetical protein